MPIKAVGAIQMTQQPDPKTEVLAGLVERVTFINLESGFSVLCLKARGVGECGGCGATAGAADVRYLTQAWLDDQSLRERILDPETTHLGFSVAASGDGSKTAVALLGG